MLMDTDYNQASATPVPDLDHSEDLQILGVGTMTLTFSFLGEGKFSFHCTTDISRGGP